MKLYFAPMEGITGYIYRNAYEKYYGSGRINKYFLPFISPSQNKGFTAKQINDILPENNICKNLVPQILTNNSDHFIKTVDMLLKYGYKEVNLNLGCPSGTVVSKYKGSGFLAIPDKIDEFLYNILSSELIVDNNIKISIKTRLGLEKPEEFDVILDIFNKYKLEELIIHPRVRTDYYKNTPDMEAFSCALGKSSNPVGYNGDVFTKEDYIKVFNKYTKVDSVMLGRGLIASPWLINRVYQVNEANIFNNETGKCDNTDRRNNKTWEYDEVRERKNLKEFHDEVYNQYLKVMSGDKNVIHKMKEVWSYMKTSFSDCDREYKNIKKAQKMQDYEAAVRSIFNNAKLIEPEKKHFW